MASALCSCLASSGGIGTAAGVGAAGGFEGGAAVDVEPESCAGGLGASGAGAEVVAAGLA